MQRGSLHEARDRHESLTNWVDSKVEQFEGCSTKQGSSTLWTKDNERCPLSPIQTEPCFADFIVDSPFVGELKWNLFDGLNAEPQKGVSRKECVRGSCVDQSRSLDKPALNHTANFDVYSECPHYYQLNDLCLIYDNHLGKAKIQYAL